MKAFLVSLSMFYNSPTGQCYVHIGYVKASKTNEFVASSRGWRRTEGLSRLMRAFASTSLLQL